MMIKKILYIGFRYEYGIKSNGAALNKKAFYDTFKTLDYEVEPIYFEDYEHKELQNAIINQAETNQSDLIFFILQSNQIEFNTLQALKDSGFFTVNFYGDDSWRFDIWSSKYANYFSACLTTEKFKVDKYKEIGQSNIIRTQWASLEPINHAARNNYKYDVSFIGGISHYRKWFIQRLLKKGIKVECFGTGWENGRASYPEMENIIQSSKINLNISNSVVYDVRYLFSNFKHVVNLIRGLKNKSDMKARMFELPAQGGFELTEFVPSLEDYFVIGKEIACYTNVDEAEDMIMYYLKNDDERESIKKCGTQKALEYHLYEHRIKEFMPELNIMKANK
jgi:spore maturation protein CgeB